MRKGRRRPWHRKKPWKYLLPAVAVGALLVVADAAWAGWTAAHALSSTRQQLELGAEALKSGDLDEAESRFEVARREAGPAAGFTAHPTAFLASLLPFIGDDVKAVRALGRAGESSAEAGSALTDAARAVHWNGSSLPGFQQAGAIDLSLMRGAAPDLSTAAAAVREAQQEVDGFSESGLLGPVRDAVATARQKLADQGGVVLAGAGLTKLLPGFLGGAAPRRYFVGFQNLSDVRGSGGFLGSYGILTASDGRLSMGPIAPTRALGLNVRGADIPEEVRIRYGPFGGATSFTAANYSPDFPTSAGVLLSLWDASGRPPLDGVIVVDPVWMSNILRVIGPVETPAWGVPLTADNITTVLLHDSFLYPYGDLAPSDEIQASIGQALWQAVLTRELPGRGLGDAMATAVAARHFQVYSRDAGEERTLTGLGAAGRVGLGRNPLFVTRADDTDNRVGYFVRTSSKHDVVLQEDGSATVSTTYTVQNTAPQTGSPSILLGQGTKQNPVGFFATDLTVYLPPDVSRIRTSVTGSPTIRTPGREFGRKVIDQYVQVAPGKEATMTITYEVRHAVVDGVYSASVIPQPGALWPSPTTVSIRTPGGSEPEEVSEGGTFRNGAANWSWNPVAPASIWVRI